MTSLRTAGLLAVVISSVAFSLEARQAEPQQAEPQEVRRLTLGDALRIAEANSPTFGQVANDATASAWGVRSAYAGFLPSLNLSGALGYRGPGTQTFLTTTFRQSSATVSSSYGATFNWSLDGQTLTEPGLRRAERDAVHADIDAAAQQLESTVTEQYLAVLQVQANAVLQRAQLERNQGNQELAEARYAVGQVTRIDPQQARVASGQAEVELLRLEQMSRVEMLRLFQMLGVAAPADPLAVELVDEFEVRPIEESLEDLLADAERGHPELLALREREAAAGWQVRSASSRFFPTVGVSAGWSGFTQQFTNIDPVIDETLQDEISSANANIAACEQQNDVFARLANPLPPQDCSALAFTPAQQVELAGLIREGNSLFPLSFTAQPFQVQLFVSLPVFNGFQRELQIAQAQAFADDAELALRDRRLGLQAEITERFHDVGRARRTIEIQAENEAAGQDQLELGRERYRLGQGSFFELLEAQLTAHQAERDHLNAIYEYHRAVTRLDAAVGRAVR